MRMALVWEHRGHIPAFMFYDHLPTILFLLWIWKVRIAEQAGCRAVVRALPLEWDTLGLDISPSRGSDHLPL